MGKLFGYCEKPEFPSTIWPMTLTATSRARIEKLIENKYRKIQHFYRLTIIEKNVVTNGYSDSRQVILGYIRS